MEIKRAAIIDDKIAICNRWKIKNPSWNIDFFYDIEEFIDRYRDGVYQLIIADYDLGYITSLEFKLGKKIRSFGYTNKLILSTVHSLSVIDQHKDIENFDGIHKKMSLDFNIDNFVN